MKKVAAIICAFNEEKTIENVIISISEIKFINEIIVVNDGSTDKTDEIIMRLKNKIDITHFHLHVNKGKGHAMAVGVEKSKSEIIVFVDADLTELSAINLANPLRKLIDPIQNDEADMVLGLPYITILNYKINPFKSLAGERSVKRDDILPLLSKMKDSKFGVETLINLYYQATGKTVKYILLAELDHLSKFNKTSAFSAAKQYIKEGQEIANTIFDNYDLILKKVKKSISQNLKK